MALSPRCGMREWHASQLTSRWLPWEKMRPGTSTAPRSRWHGAHCVLSMGAAVSMTGPASSAIDTPVPAPNRGAPATSASAAMAIRSCRARGLTRGAGLLIGVIRSAPRRRLPGRSSAGPEARARGLGPSRIADRYRVYTLERSGRPPRTQASVPSPRPHPMPSSRGASRADAPRESATLPLKAVRSRPSTCTKRPSWRSL